MIWLYAEPLRHLKHRRVYTQSSVTHKRIYTVTLVRADAFACSPPRRHLWHTQAPAHTCGYTHRRLYTRTVLQSVAVTHAGTSHTHAQTLAHTFTHWPFYTRANALTHGLFPTQPLLHTGVYTQTPWRTRAGRQTHRHFCTQMLLHTDAFTPVLLHTRANFRKNYLLRFHINWNYLVKRKLNIAKIWISKRTLIIDLNL